jgi:hypothetical protein
MIETQYILRLWLNIVPDYTVTFARLILVNTLIDSFIWNFNESAQASGKIKIYQIVVGGLLLCILPVSYLFLKLGYPPQITFYVSIVFSILALFARLFIYVIWFQ